LELELELELEYSKEFCMARADFPPEVDLKVSCESNLN
jgi:hypothetical protein